MNKLSRLILAIVCSMAVTPAWAQLPLTGMEAYYKFEDLTDSHGVNHLTAFNSPTFAAGKILNAVNLEADNTQRLSVADNASLSTGDVSFYVSVWVNLESKGAQRVICGKADGTNIEWVVDYLNTTDRYRFYIRSAGGTFRTVSADNFGVPPTGTWTHIVAWHDAAGDTVNIRVNNGTANSTATVATAPPDTTSPLRFGSGSDTTLYWDGLIDEFAFGKGHVITTGEQDALWNGGDGITLVVDSIVIQSPASPEIVQKDVGTDVGDIAISGTYTAAGAGPTAIEARVVWSNPVHTGTWTTIDAAPAGGTYSGTLANQPQGSGQVEVRWANDTGVTATQTSVGIGRVFATAGQSNMQGRATSFQTLTNPGSQLALMFRENSTGWLALADNTDSDIALGSPVPHIASTLLAADPDCPVAFITACDGGTSILVTPFEWQIPTGTSYVDLLDSVTLADPPAIEGVLWLQGEGEAYANQTTSAYYAAMLPLFEAFNDLPGEPWVMVCQLGQIPTAEANGLDPIRQAQRKTWPLSYVRPGATWHDVVLSDNGGDSLHALETADITTLGTRIGLAVDGNTPPVIKAVQTTAGSGTVTITYDQALQTQASLTTTAWSVPGYTVTGASASGSAVTLTISPVATAAPIAVTHCSANTGVGATVPLSTAGMPAAAETFHQSTGVYTVARP